MATFSKEEAMVSAKEIEAKKVLTYEDFDLTTFKKLEQEMVDFRTNCYGENMERIWTKIRELYIPRSVDAVGMSKYTMVNEATANLGTAIPDIIVGASANDELLKFMEPIVAVKIHTALSLLTQRTPDVRWDSDSDEYEKNAQVVNALRIEDWLDGQVRSQYVMLWFYKVMFGITHWRRFYEKLEREVSLPSRIDLSSGTEKTKYEKVNLVDFDGTTAEALSPFQVWIDPRSLPNKPRSRRRVMWEKVYDYDEFVRRFEKIGNEKEMKRVQGTAVTGHAGTDNVKVRFFEDMDLDLFYVVANDDFEIVKDHLPQNHKQLSVRTSIWMPRGDANPHGLGPIEMMLEDKRVLDEFKSMTMTQVKFSIYKAVFYTGSLMTDSGESGEISIRPDRAYKVSDKVQFMDMPGPGNDSWQAMTELRARIDDASGINRPLGGEIVKTTAFQTDLAKDAALARLSVPISNMVLLLAEDAELAFELQKQHYTLPQVKELVEPDEISEASDELANIRASGKEPNFDIWVDQDNVDEEGNIVPRVFKGTYREAQLNISKRPDGQYIPAAAKQTMVLTGPSLNWKGKIHVIADSILSITPTVEKTRKMEMYNILIPMFSQPPELVAKPAKAIVKLYGEDADDVLPESFLAYLKQVESGEMNMPATVPAGVPSGQSPEAAMAAGAGNSPGVTSSGAMAFNQQAAPTVVTNINGQKDAVSATSERLR